MADNSTILHAEDVVPVRSRVSWGAIFAGAAIAFAIYFVLALLGTAIGLSINDRTEADNLNVFAAIWVSMSLALGLLAGGYATSQCIAGENKMEAAVHGVILWAVLFFGSVLLASSAVPVGISALLLLAQSARMPADTVNAFAWWSLLGVLVSMACSILGAWLGAGPTPRFLAVTRTPMTTPAVTDREVRSGL